MTSSGPDVRGLFLGDLQPRAPPKRNPPVSRIPNCTSAPGEPRLQDREKLLPGLPEVRFFLSALRALGEDGVRKGTFQNRRRRVRFSMGIFLFMCVRACVPA